MLALAAVVAAHIAVVPVSVGNAREPSLAPEVPHMTAPVVHVHSVRHTPVSSLPFVEHFLPRGTENAVGSGFIVDARGLILTNNHVVADADRVTVTIDDHELPAEVVGRDKDLDVALLRVHARHKLPVARLGHSASARVGDFVVAVGNPFGLDHTVTSGIISARMRLIEDAMRVPLIQTDASINPGNSGGPLYDLHGNVIAINTAIVAGANGIGFAVPIDFVRRALPQLEQSGHISRGFLGVSLTQVTPDIADALGVHKRHGALVSGVVPGSPGALAGMQVGDVIVRWDGEPVESSISLPLAIALSPPGSTVHVEVVREHSPVRLHVKMGKPPRP